MVLFSNIQSKDECWGQISNTLLVDDIVTWVVVNNDIFGKLNASNDQLVFIMYGSATIGVEESNEW